MKITIKELRCLIHNALLSEAQRDADYLKKINMRKIRDSEPDLDPRELQIRGSDGPVFDKRVLDLVASLEDHQLPRKNRKQFIKWLANAQLRGAFYLDRESIPYLSDWINGTDVEISDLPTRFDDAYRLADQWHESLSKNKKFGSAIKTTGQENVVYEFSNDFKIIELAPEECRSEGDSMGHCVGGDEYAEDVRSGRMKIFSLRDPENRPHATVSVVPGGSYGWKIDQIKGKQNQVPVEKYASRVKEWLKTTKFDILDSVDYVNILSIDEKKNLLAKSRSRPGAFLDLVSTILKISELEISKRDYVRFCLGAAMAATDLTPDPKKTRELFDFIRDWTEGKLLDKDFVTVTDELWTMRNAVVRSFSAAVTERPILSFLGLSRAYAWITDDLRAAGISPQKIIDSIEKEIGMPLEDFLIKNT